MIDVRELRIGNWVIFNGANSEVTISQLSHNLHNYFEPIPLTPEILEKCGFTEIANSGDFYSEQYNFGLNKESDGNFSVYNNYDLEIKNIQLKHLHQLQNLVFLLTNQELSPNI